MTKIGRIIRKILGEGKEPSGRAQSSLLTLQQIIDELNVPSTSGDHWLRQAELCVAALKLVDRRRQPELWAALEVTLGNSLAQNPKGSRAENAENMEQAIGAYEGALTVYTREAMPVEWATTTMNLAGAYTKRIRGEREENLESAIALYEQALTVRTREAMPMEWATTTMNLASAYSDRIQGERAKSLEHAIALYEQALTVRTQEAMPVEWATTTANLASTYRDRIQGEREENLERAIALYEQALTVYTRESMPLEWARTTRNLAIAYMERIRGGRADNLDRAVELYEQALTVRTQEAMPVEWATTTVNLADAYSDRVRGERAENLERAIRLYEQALTVYTRESMPLEWARTTRNLAIAYTERIRGEHADNLDRAVQLYEQALTVYTREETPEEWATTTTDLALACWKQIRGDRVENLERAIRLYEQALTVYTREAMPLEWARTTRNLAIAYTERIRGERVENLERAIALSEQALTVYTQAAMPVDWAGTMHNLAIACTERIRGERAENLERAIQLYEQTLTVYRRESMPVDWARTTMNLANAYKDRIRGERAENLERAIALSEQTLTVMTQAAMPVDWAGTMHNLAIACTERIRGERAENLERAIQLYEQTLTVYRRESMPVDWARTTMNLANAYKDRIRGERAENLERAIKLYELALTVRTQESMPVQWAITSLNLANAYKDRIRGERAENLERAIALSEQTLTVMTQAAVPVDWAMTTMNLAIAYQNRIRGERAENLERAIQLYEQTLTVYRREAMPVDWARATMNLAIVYQNRIRGERAENLERAIQLYEQSLTVRTRETMPVEHRTTQKRLGDLFLAGKDWVRAAMAYHRALDAQEVIFEAAATSEARMGELTTVQQVPACLGYALAAQENPDLREAVTVLEQGRARSLADALDLDQTVPEQVSGHDRVEVENARKRIVALEAEGRLREGIAERKDYVAYAQALGKARGELRQVVERIRGYVPEFLPRAQFEDIVQVAQQAQMIYLAATAAGGIALSVSVEGSTVDIQPVFLPGLVEDQLRRKLNRYWGAFQAWHRFSGKCELRQQALNALDELLRWLWDAAMKEIVSLLSPERLTMLIPTGLLGFLPLHAAWTEDASAPTGRHYALDSGLIAYTPSAKVLSWARGGAGVLADSIFGIDEPRPTNASPLPNSSYEVETALSYFEPNRRKRLQHEQARHADVMQACREYEVLHFSCHGYANFKQPLESGLLMADDELLSVRDFLGLHLKRARLAVLSACETGLPGADAPDEMIGLPAGLLQAGVAGVVGSMWSVSDASTMMLMTRFYELWREEHLEPAAALRVAQQWVRDSTNKEKAEHFKVSVPEFRTTGHRTASTTAEWLYQNMVLEEENHRALAHPFYWAGFSYFGA